MRLVEHIVHVATMLGSGYGNQRFNPDCISMLCPSARHLICIASVNSAVK